MKLSVETKDFIYDDIEIQMLLFQTAKGNNDFNLPESQLV